MEINVGDNDPDIEKRLDLFLSLKLPQHTRSSLKRLIEDNKVNINGELCYKAGYKVKAGDRIDLPDLESEIANRSGNLPKSPFDLEVLYEDEDYLFINKPTGLVVHPTTPYQNDTLVNKLISLYEDLPSNGIARPGIVHRLDKDTSGVIVVAKTAKALWWVTGQFAQRKVKKEYVSIGLNTDLNFRYKKGESFEYECNISRSYRNRKKFVATSLQNEVYAKGRYSKSLFCIEDVITLRPKLHLIYSRISPLTGRTHQIRVHQRALNFPILGDEVYLSPKESKISARLIKELNVDQRLYLHAYSVTFENYNRKVYSISAQISFDHEILNYREKSPNEYKNWTEDSSQTTSEKGNSK